jgi:hypothetical protein
MIVKKVLITAFAAAVLAGFAGRVPAQTRPEPSETFQANFTTSAGFQTLVPLIVGSGRVPWSLGTNQGLLGLLVADQPIGLLIVDQPNGKLAMIFQNADGSAQELLLRYDLGFQYLFNTQNIVAANGLCGGGPLSGSCQATPITAPEPRVWYFLPNLKQVPVVPASLIRGEVESLVPFDPTGLPQAAVYDTWQYNFPTGSQVQQVDLLAEESEPNIPLAMLWQTPWPVALAFNTWKTTGLDQVCFNVPEFCP